jgi:predicted DNA-binding transcriptional regulator AlpA
MLDAISEQIAQRTAQIVIAHLAPVIQPKPVEVGQIVGVTALARYLGCGKDRVYVLMTDPAFPVPRMVGHRRVWSKADVSVWR